MNVTKKPFDDLRVRQALNYAMDKNAFVKVVWSGYEDPLTSPMPPKLAFYAKQRPWPYDPAKAKSLLAEAGYRDGFETEIWAQQQPRSIAAAMQFMQQQLGAVGVKVTVTPLEAGAAGPEDLVGAEARGQPAASSTTARWSSSTGDADWALRPLFWSTGASRPSCTTSATTATRTWTSDLEDALETADPTKRAELLRGCAEAHLEGCALDLPGGATGPVAAQSKTLTGALHDPPDGGLLIERRPL